MSPKTKPADLLELTTAEIARQVMALNKRRDEITAELASICSEAMRAGSFGTELVLGEDEKAAREWARLYLKGNAPEYLELAPSVSRERELQRERRGIDMALKILGDKQLTVRAVEVAQWAEDHSAEWRSLSREITLAFVRLEALEHRSLEMAQESGIGEFACSLPMAPYFGRPFYDLNTKELSAAALAEGVVTRSEIKDAQNVRLK